LEGGAGIIGELDETVERPDSHNEAGIAAFSGKPLGGRKIEL
jgi:hypothetical protein